MAPTSKISSHFGISPHQYVLQCRIQQAKQLLQYSHLSIAEVAYTAGFGSQSHMTTVFRKVLQITPAIYRKQVAIRTQYH